MGIKPVTTPLMRALGIRTVLLGSIVASAACLVAIASPEVTVGRTTGVVERDLARPRVGLAMTLLPAVVPRALLRADPRTAGMEVLRVPRMSNPSVVTPGEMAVVEELISR